MARVAQGKGNKARTTSTPQRNSFLLQNTQTRDSDSKNNEPSRTTSTPRKPKTPRTPKTEQKPDPTRQKKINHFTRRHKFVTQQSFGTYTTSQRRAFERDVYDYARALGFVKARANASVLTARTLCGEEDYDSDDTRLDDDEMDDSSVVLVSLPASTRIEISHSSLGASFSATSPSIPWSGDPARTGSEVLPSVEVQETPQGKSGNSKRNRNRVEDSSTEPKGKRRKTESDRHTKTPEDNNGDAMSSTSAQDLLQMQTTDSDGRQNEAPGVHPLSINKGKSSAVSRNLHFQTAEDTSSQLSGNDEERAKSRQPEQHGWQSSQEPLKRVKGEGKKHQANRTTLFDNVDSNKKKRKGQFYEPESQSAPTSSEEIHTSTVGLNDVEYQRADKKSKNPKGPNTHAHGTKVEETSELRREEEKTQRASPTAKPQENTEGAPPKGLLHEERETLPQTNKELLDGSQKQLQSLESQEKPKKKGSHGVNAKSRQNKTLEDMSKQTEDNGIDLRARELIRAQDAARRAREEEGRTEKAVADGENQRTNGSAFTEENITAVQRKEKKNIKREMKKKKRHSEGSPLTVTGTISVGSSPPVAAGHGVAQEFSRDDSSRSAIPRPQNEAVLECPSTPIKRRSTSTASSPLSSLPPTPRWPTPSRDNVKAEDEEKPQQRNFVEQSKTTASGLTPTKKRKLSSKASPYFISSPKPRREQVSCIPFPPLSSTSFGLVQESLQSNPFHLLIAVIFLNKTRGAVAMPIFYTFITRFPSPSSLASANLPEVVSFFQNLGLQNQRAKKCIALANAWLEHPPTKAKRWRRLHYPNLGDGKDIKSSEEPITEQSEDPRVAWEVGHLPGIGAYGIDSWRIFCRDELRGLGTATLPEFPADGGDDGFKKRIEEEEMVREWTRVLPLDKELRAYLRWRWLRLGWDWDPKTGERRKAEEKVMKAAQSGGVICEGDQGWSLERAWKEEEIRQVGGLCGVEHGNADS
ncbi:MAG: hypothetical protein Q9172_004578 [Xanthocarpia lactea]